MSFINVNRDVSINQSDTIKILPAMIVQINGQSPGPARDISYRVGVWDNTDYYELNNVRPLDRYGLAPDGTPIQIKARPVGYLVQAYKIADNIYFNFTEKLNIEACEE